VPNFISCKIDPQCLENSFIPSRPLGSRKDVLAEKATIEDGIGAPIGNLVLYLVICWTLVAVIVSKGIHSSGKASYFLALFPYVIMLVLLIRALTLPGAIDGVVYFLRPDWQRILEPGVWYNAVTQVFFSLTVCFGCITMYASYNKFNHNIRRDALIVTTLDTFTSLLAGCTIFGILGNLAYQTGVSNVGEVVKSQTGLAFISYPDAIAKFESVPQVFSVLFFFMLFVLGIGSNVAQMSCVMTVVRDKFPNIANWKVATIYAIAASLVGLVFVTPGGQFLVTIVDFYGASFITFVLAIAQLAVIGWIYGVRRFCLDIEFMVKKKSNLYWRACWLVVTPVLIIAIFIYFMIGFEQPTYKGYVYPTRIYGEYFWPMFLLTSIRMFPF
jgi:solute carrier family 6 (neurotransmitter transporter, glycine) member 5/9